MFCSSVKHPLVPLGVVVFRVVVLPCRNKPYKTTPAIFGGFTIIE